MAISALQAGGMPILPESGMGLPGRSILIRSGGAIRSRVCDRVVRVRLRRAARRLIAAVRSQDRVDQTAGLASCSGNRAQ
jgi:hypothetical protein